MRINNNLIRYIHKPTSRDLLIQEKIEAVTVSIFIGVLTLGIAQLASWSLEKRKITHENNRYREKSKRFYKIMSTTGEVSKKLFEKKLTSDPSDLIKHKREKLGLEIQEKFIRNGYGTQFPPRKEILVPHPRTHKLVKWGSLTQNEKVQVNNNHAFKHGQLKGSGSRLLVDYFVAPPGHGNRYLPNDPRRIHGNDHSARVAIFFAAFANLYLKYHPHCKLSEEDILIGQLIAAGHDIGREADGTDLFDDRSAEKTSEILKEMGYGDEIIRKCVDAISNKDADPLKDKSWIAKCLQNADSADFVRTLKVKKSYGMRFSKKQNKKQFKESQQYLDIFKELTALASDEKGKLNPEHVLEKSGFQTLIFADFQYELDSLRAELNDFIYLTNSKSIRSQLSKEGLNIYDEMLSYVTHTRFPLLHMSLQNLGVISSLPNPEEQAWREEIDNLHLLIQQTGGVGILTEEMFENYLQRIRLPEGVNVHREDIPVLNIKKDDHLVRSDELKNILENAVSLQNAYFDAKMNFLENQNEAKSFVTFMEAYGALSPTQKDAVRGEAQELIKNSALDESSYSACPELLSAKADLEHEKHFNEGNTANASELIKHAQEIIEAYNKIGDRSLQDPRQLSTAACLYKEASTLLLEDNKVKEANDALKEAGDLIVFLEDDPRFNFRSLFPEKNNYPSEKVINLLRGAGYIRHHRLRVSETAMEFPNKIGRKHILELSFELSTARRNQLQDTLKKLQKELKRDPDITIKKVPAEYLPKNKGVICPGPKGMVIGSDTLYKFKSGVEIRIGSNEKYKNQYNFVRIRVPDSTSIQEAHKALSRLGFPMALLPPRNEDLRVNAIARALHILYPDKVYKNFPKLTTSRVYDQLTSQEKAKVDCYAAGAELKPFGGHTIEQVFPNAAEDARANGGETLASFLFGGKIENIGKIVRKILSSGVLSASERFQRGIISGGYVPRLNYATGSGNQVFARTLTGAQLRNSKSFNDFPLNGPVLALIDIQAFERMPYFYFEDRGGLRNAKFKTRLPWYVPREGLRFRYAGHIPRYDGKVALRDRPSLFKFCKGLKESGTFSNETVFNHSFDPHYILGLMVESQYDKAQLMDSLERQGVHHIRGKKLEEAIVVTKHGVTQEKVDELKSKVGSSLLGVE